MDLIAVSEAFRVTFFSVLIWLLLFPLLVQGLVIYAIVLARGERRENEAYRRNREL